MSVDLNTFFVDYVEFYARVGGSNSLLCNGAASRENSVLLQHSNDGGITWTLLKELRSSDHGTSRFVCSEACFWSVSGFSVSSSYATVIGQFASVI